MPGRTETATAWPVDVFRPYPECERLVFGRCAARSAEFGGNSAAGGDAVIIGSAAGPDPDSVVPRARGELVERASNILAGRAAERASGHVVGSYAELRRRGVPALDPAAFRAGGGGVRAGRDGVRDARMLWVRGESLVTGAEAMVPAGAVHLRHRPPPGCAAPVRAGSTGLGAAPTGERAARHAVLEVCERDLIVAAWYAEQPPATCFATLPPSVEVLDLLGVLGLRVRLWALAGPGRLACVLACVFAPDGGRQSFGGRCVPLEGGRVPAAAVDTAVYEALMVRWSMSTPASARARLALRDRLPRDALEHAVHAFDQPYAMARLTARLDPAAPEHAVPVPESAAEPARLLAAATGEDVIAVDTSAPEFAGPNAAVVRVVAPGARRLPGTEPADSTVPPHPFG